MFWFFVHEAWGILVHCLRIEPAPPALEGEVSTIGLTGESPPNFLPGSYLTVYFRMYLFIYSLTVSPTRTQDS